MSQPTTKGTSPKTYFKLQKQILRVCGISVAPNESKAYRLYAFVLLVAIFLPSPILQVYEFFKDDFETSYSFVVYQMGTITLSGHAIWVIINRKNFSKILAKLEEGPFLPNPNRGGNEEERLVRECIRKTNLQTYMYLSLVGLAVFVGVVFSASTRIRSGNYHNWQLPYGPLNVLDITYSPNFEITLLYQGVTTSLICVVYGTITSMIADTLAHIQCQFMMLQNFIGNIFEHARKEMLKDIVEETETVGEEGQDCKIKKKIRKDDKIHWKYLQKSIKEIVEYHVAILDFVQELEKCIRYMLLVTFLANIGFLCLKIFQISDNTIYGTIRQLTEYASGSVAIILISYWSEKISSQSEKVGNVAYKVEFVGTDIRFQKALVMIIMRSQNSSKITAGKFVNLCLNTYIWILKAAYRLYIVLRSTK